MRPGKTIYLGIKGSVIALDDESGEVLWSVHLKGSEFVNVALGGGKVFATTHGEIFCLDSASGSLLWHNRLKGYGYGMASIVGEGIVSSAGTPLVELELRRQQAASASAAGGSPAS